MAEPISYIARKYIEEGYDFIVAEIQGDLSKRPGSVMLMREGGHIVGSLGSSTLTEAAAELAHQMLRTKEETVQRDLPDGTGEDTVTPISLRYIHADAPGHFVEEFRDRSRAYIFGAGNVAAAVEPVLRHIDFDTVVIDTDASYANVSRFPSAEVIVCSDFEHSFDALTIDADSYIVIVTRGHKGDLPVLRQALQRSCAYIGMLGSRRKNQHLYEILLSEGVAQSRIDEVHAPIGLDLGSQTPEEIGVSIAAEIIQVRAALKSQMAERDTQALLHEE